MKMMKSNRCIPNSSTCLLTVILLLFSPLLCEGTLSKSNPKKAKPASTASPPSSASSDTPTRSVFDRELVKEKFKIKDLLAHHSSVCKSCVKTRQFATGASLAYVTPWNNRGYDVAKEFTKKFTHTH